MASQPLNEFIGESIRSVSQAWKAAADRRWREGKHRAIALGTIADALTSQQQGVLRIASEETALTTEELVPEFARMVRTFRLFAERVADGSWRRSVACPPEADPARAIGPNHDLRAMLVPRRGVAIVFGASNFPLAYGTCGGDTASALAAGLGVVVKEHPGHRETGRLIAKIAREALSRCGFSPDLLGYAQEADDEGRFEVAEALVTHELAAAVGFTGSFGGGMAIEKLARSRPIPIPVFAEMGSTNPVFVTRAALEARGEAIAREIGASLLARFGQQCTCPGLVLIESAVLMPTLARETEGRVDPVADAFESELAATVRAAPARQMLTARVREGYVKQVNRIGGYIPEVEVLATGATAAANEKAGDRSAPAMLLRTDIDELRTLRFLSEEAFGPSTVVARFASSRADMLEDLFEMIQGHLVACVYAEAEEMRDASSLARALMDRLMDVAGRVVVNGVPTGVRVCDAMVHSGPMPACNAPESTAVGPRAIERWCRPVCLQNWPMDALPEGLRGE